MQRSSDGAQITSAVAAPSPSAAKNGLTTVDPLTSTLQLHHRQTQLVRPTLPSRNVTAATIEEAYVSFILYCNPAVALPVETAELRIAFRSPPKSEGKTFSTFTLFELIKKLDSKEIKTWAELATRLGVEKPKLVPKVVKNGEDQDETPKMELQSSQKIQQYAVRLKRWMHSMHVDAFFDYLMDHPHPYWTQIPADPNPVREEGRDGVLAEDDMALRALIPSIRPRRGRKRPDDDESHHSPPQRSRMDGHDDFASHLGPWSAHPDGRGAFALPLDPLRSAVNGPPSAWPSNDIAQTPLTAYPHSAITPSTGQIFWAEPGEPRSAITPNRPKAGSRRYGAKAVSSAWRTGGPTSGGKTRGRPPKAALPGPFALDGTSFKAGPPTPTDAAANNNTTSSGSSATPSPIVIADPSLSRPAGRPAKPSISLQVPERAGGEVRLATPPLPTVVVNGETQTFVGPADQPMITDQVDGNITHLDFSVMESMLASYSAQTPSEMTTPAQPSPAGKARGNSRQQQQQQQQMEKALATKRTGPRRTCPPGFFREMRKSDPTNLDAVHRLLVSEVMRGDWVDEDGGSTAEPCTLDEADAVVDSLLEDMYSTAASDGAFLVSLAAMLGGRLLMSTSKMRVQRRRTRPEGDGSGGNGGTTYSCGWEYRLGRLLASYQMTQTVPLARWRPPEREVLRPEEEKEGDGEYWKRKYESLLGQVEKKDEEMERLKADVLNSLRGPGLGP